LGLSPQASSNRVGSNTIDLPENDFGLLAAIGAVLRQSSHQSNRIKFADASDHPAGALRDGDFECFGTGTRCGQRSFQYDRKREGTAHDAQSSLIPTCLSSHGPGGLEQAQGRQGLTPLAASQRVDVLHALRQRHFKPAFADHPLLLPHHLGKQTYRD
jgi:hypothetical protein